MIKENINNSNELTELLESKGGIQAVFPCDSNLILAYNPSEDGVSEAEDFGKSLGRSLHRR